ncbi:MAG: succinyl-diaminopimelate desuccinylase [Zetaproteobacteria bacterium]|nr:MAG: succinyl-diaminopimelate desuccinylase [Zetaproteobacteria bacterium]
MDRSHRSAEPALSYAVALIARPSVTPADGGCQEWIARQLAPLGFRRFAVNHGGVINSLFVRRGNRPGCLCFAGHTDVVPPGPEEEWRYPPFSAVVRDGLLHGRGAQDMKGAIACWMAAVEGLIAQGADLPTLQLAVTSDEEGEAVDGTRRIVQWLQQEGWLPDAVVVGEPSSLDQVGDVVRCGRRGVVQGRITVHGRQGHSAYPQDADNAIHRAIPLLARIAALDWGPPAPGFPPTTCQITNLTGGTGAINVIPGSCSARIDVRYNPANSYEEIRSRLEDCCAGQPVELDLQHAASAFSTGEGPLLDLVRRTVEEVCGHPCRPDTGGGTSDGRFFAGAGVPVVELGLTNRTIHQVDERVAVEELALLTALYRRVIEGFSACLGR